MSFGFFKVPCNFLHRIIIYGRRGSGCKTQAIALEKRFNLIYIDGEKIMYDCLQSTDDLGKELRESFITNNIAAISKIIGKAVSRRLLQIDALHRGWVIVNYPRNLLQLRDVFENFSIPPNRFVFLDCSELCAKQRIYCRGNQKGFHRNMEYVEKEMVHYNDHEMEMKDYLARRHETIYVNSMSNFKTVQNSLLSKLDCRAYVMGFKN